MTEEEEISRIEQSLWGKSLCKFFEVIDKPDRERKFFEAFNKLRGSYLEQLESMGKFK